MSERVGRRGVLRMTLRYTDAGPECPDDRFPHGVLQLAAAMLQEALDEAEDLAVMSLVASLEAADAPEIAPKPPAWARAGLDGAAGQTGRPREFGPHSSIQSATRGEK